VFDKTGTLTEGRFGVSDIAVLADGNEAEELRFAASAESQSEHPIAQGIVAAAKERGIAVPRPASVRNITGEGIVAVAEGEEVGVVSPGYLTRLGQTIRVCVSSSRKARALWSCSALANRAHYSRWPTSCGRNPGKRWPN